MPTGQADTLKKAPRQRPLTAQQLRFVEELCVNWNKAGAARRAGYTQDNAKQMAQKLWRDPRIKAAVAKRAEELTMATGEATVRMSSWGRASIADVYSLAVVAHTPRIEKPLVVVIEELQAEMQFEEQVTQQTTALLPEAARADYEGRAFQEHLGRQMQLIRYELELQRNPTATKWVNGPTVAREEAQLDLVKALKLEAAGLIKKITPTRYGIGVELYDAKDAVVQVLKLHGAYAPEKHDLTTKGEALQPGSNIYVPDNGR